MKTAPHRIRLAPAGRHTRYTLAAYLRHVFMVASVLLAIALTIDLWPQFQMVAAYGGADGLAALWNVVRFSALRAPGLVAPFLPFATFLGVVWAEVAHTQSGERMLVWNSGRSPLQCLVPVLLLGVILGAADFGMDGYLGPASMAVQMHERIGRDGIRLDRTRMGDPAWIALPNGLLKTNIQYGPPPVLRHLTFFERDADGRLTDVDMAAVARRIPGTDTWLMHNGRSWKPGQKDSAAVEVSETSGEVMTPFARKTITFNLDPLWLSVYNMGSQYLSFGVLQRLALSHRGSQPMSEYRTRLQTLYGEIVLPGAMALAASALCLLLLAYSTPWKTVVLIVFIGYLAHFGIKACLLMGQNGYMPSVAAGWLVPLALLALTAGILGILARQRRRAEHRDAPLSAG